MTWNKYPEFKPPETKVTEMKWYWVILEDGSVSQACWWVNHWYCFSDWDKITGWEEIANYD